jgi:signal peptidase I
MTLLEQPTRRLSVESGSSVNGVVRWVGQLLAWLLILTICAVLALAVLVPRLGGATPYTILTSSMQPHMPPGTLVVVKPVAPEEIGIGTVITYQLHSGEPEVVTHRVIEVRTNLEGETEWRTQGDANDTPDELWVKEVQVRGALWYSVPELGRVSLLLSGEQRQVAVYVVAGALALYAGYLFTSAGVGRTRRRRRDV